MGTIQFWLFVFGIYLVHQWLHNALIDWITFKAHDDLFTDYTPHLLIGSLGLMVAFFMCIRIYLMVMV